MATRQQGVFMESADVLIVGAGPSGLSAGITLASEGKSVIILEKSDRAGGQIGTTSWVENYPGSAEGFSGKRWTEEATRQCAKFGADIHYNTEVQEVCEAGGDYILCTSEGLYHAPVVLLALGLHNKRLGVPGEDLPQVHHGMNVDALQCVGGEHVVLVGGGNSAGQAAAYYLDQGAKVTFVIRRPLYETMSDYLLQRLVAKVAHYRGSVERFEYDGYGVVAVVVDVGEYKVALPAHCAHIFTGLAPSTDWLRGFVMLDGRGYIKTDRNHQTGRDGVYAVGDVESGSPGRLTCAVGDANRAVKSIHRYLTGRHADGLEERRK
jgi:thioredoxin reductase (NADPH)